MAKAEVFLQLKGVYSYDGKRVFKAELANATKKKPVHPQSGAIVVKLVIDVPDQAFLPYEPTAEVKIGMDQRDIAILDLHKMHKSLTGE